VGSLVVDEGGTLQGTCTRRDRSAPGPKAAIKDEPKPLPKEEPKAAEAKPLEPKLLETPKANGSKPETAKR
jgi:hypothetical protein